MVKENMKISHSMLCAEITKKTEDQDVPHKCTITNPTRKLGFDLYIKSFLRAAFPLRLQTSKTGSNSTPRVSNK